VQPAARTGPAIDWTDRTVTVDHVVDQPVTQRLYERLRPEDVAALEAALDDELATALRTAPAPFRNGLALAFGVWIREPAVLERTGLTPAEPPPEIHAMSRGPMAAGGDLYSADLVAAALAGVGVDIEGLGRALDLGCSSGRTLRPLSAAYPQVEWHGADPNRDAVAWAAEHLPGLRFQPSESDPPLPYPDAHFGAVYAVSIWSHFAEAAARRWFDELRRVLLPGGHAVITVHAHQSIAYYGARGERPPEQLDEIGRALHRSGFWYANEFGQAGDHGVAHPDWGTAFMSLEWLLRAVTPEWAVVDYAVGRNADNQDLVVLRRSL
jgi:SAM-dependent methyltransferase